VDSGVRSEQFSGVLYFENKKRAQNHQPRLYPVILPESRKTSSRLTATFAASPLRGKAIWNNADNSNDSLNSAGATQIARI
jgi:hypothetical protein